VSAFDVIRDATPADLPAINDIYNYYVGRSTCTFAEQPETLTDRRAWFEAHGPTLPVIVAESAGEVIAWASLSTFNRRCAYRTTVESSLYVRHDRHRRGVGLHLMEELIRRAGQLGHHTIIAGISADQSASIALHEKLGFEKVAHLREVGYKFGRWLDVIYMQRMI